MADGDKKKMGGLEIAIIVVLVIIVFWFIFLRNPNPVYNIIRNSLDAPGDALDAAQGWYQGLGNNKHRNPPIKK